MSSKFAKFISFLVVVASGWSRNVANATDLVDCVGQNGKTLEEILTGVDTTLLEVIDCFQVPLSGSIPTTISRFTNLRALELSDTGINGKLPTELGLLSKLTFIDAIQNDLTGPLPTELGRLSNMDVLGFFDNRMGGLIPTELSSLTRLSVFDMEANDFSGTIPRNVFNPRMVFLATADTEIGGTIPTQIGLCNQLTHLDMSSSRMGGLIPTEIGNLVALPLFKLPENQFVGTIPTEIGRMEAMKDFEINLNSFGGKFPSEVGLLRNLETLFVGNNKFVGTMPAHTARETDTPAGFAFTKEEQNLLPLIAAGAGGALVVLIAGTVTYLSCRRKSQHREDKVLTAKATYVDFPQDMYAESVKSYPKADFSPRIGLSANNYDMYPKAPRYNFNAPPKNAFQQPKQAKQPVRGLRDFYNTYSSTLHDDHPDSVGTVDV